MKLAERVASSPRLRTRPIVLPLKRPVISSTELLTTKDGPNTWWPIQSQKTFLPAPCLEWKTRETPCFLPGC